MSMMVENGGVKHPLRFDRTLNLGHVLTIFTLLGTMGIAYATYSVTVAGHDLRLRFLEAQVSTLTNLNVELKAALASIKQDVAVIRDRLERQVERQNRP